MISSSVSVTIEDGESKIVGNKKYISSKEYNKTNVDIDNVWTLQIGDVVVFGECPKEINPLYTIERLTNDYRHMIISAVSDSSDQGTLPMWKIEGV
jgi:hypothetical protein